MLLKPMMVPRRFRTLDARRLTPRDLVNVPGDARVRTIVPGEVPTPLPWFNFERADPRYIGPGMRLAGFLYYHPPNSHTFPVPHASRLLLAGALRFRCTEKEGTFQDGWDLPGEDGLPWELGLPRLMAMKRFNPLVDQIMENGLMTQGEMAKCRRLISSGNPSSGEQTRPVPVWIHALGQPFSVDLTQVTTGVVVGPHSLLKADIYPRVAEQGSVIVCLERAPWLSDDEEALVMRVLHIHIPVVYLYQYAEQGPLEVDGFMPWLQMGPRKGTATNVARPWVWEHTDREPMRSAALHCLFHPTDHFGEAAADREDIEREGGHPVAAKTALEIMKKVEGKWLRGGKSVASWDLE
ncbi:hypothetical protein DFH07DRAFT_824344 [Mycena maculata]|uniref:Uncharacterized protein n=1 Tax=Mycena maculata TaxID=230809 RepID=A0AAD7IYU2_9AGAR|nr:hypothetical protein DFH07DRAFT_824344 [Mycena maculata]